RDRKAVIGKCALEHGFHLPGLRRLGVNQEELIALLSGIELEEVGFGEQQLALEDAILEQADDTKAHRLAPVIGYLQFLSQAAFQDPLNRIGFAESRNDAALGRLLQKQPRI